MSEMFCFQCQQTAGGSGCVRTGVCGKQPETAALQDALVCRLIQLAEACLRQGSSRKRSPAFWWTACLPRSPTSTLTMKLHPRLHQPGWKKPCFSRMAPERGTH